MKTINEDKRPCFCPLDVGSCYCEWDDEDWSKLELSWLSKMLAREMEQARRIYDDAVKLPKPPKETRGLINLAKAFERND